MHIFLFYVIGTGLKIFLKENEMQNDLIWILGKLDQLPRYGGVNLSVEVQF